jgi:hypothetical protein
LAKEEGFGEAAAAGFFRCADSLDETDLNSSRASMTLSVSQLKQLPEAVAQMATGPGLSDRQRMASADVFCAKSGGPMW